MKLCFTISNVKKSTRDSHLSQVEACCIITARIRRMTGGYIFTLCVSPHLGGVPTFRMVGGGTYSQVRVGGGYLLSGPGGGGVPTLRSGWGGVPTFPGPGGGGTY